MGLVFLTVTVPQNQMHRPMCLLLQSVVALGSSCVHSETVGAGPRAILGWLGLTLHSHTSSEVSRVDVSVIPPSDTGVVPRSTQSPL